MMEYKAERLISIMSSGPHISVMLYLERFNPDISPDKLSSALKMKNEDVANVLNDLINENIAAVRSVQNFALTDYGRFVVKRLHEITGIKWQDQQTQIN